MLKFCLEAPNLLGMSAQKWLYNQEFHPLSPNEEISDVEVSEAIIATLQEYLAPDTAQEEKSQNKPLPHRDQASISSSPILSIGINEEDLLVPTTQVGRVSFV